MPYEPVPAPIHVRWTNTPNVSETLTPNAGESQAEFIARAKAWFNNLIDTHPPTPN